MATYKGRMINDFTDFRVSVLISTKIVGQSATVTSLKNVTVHDIQWFI